MSQALVRSEGENKGLPSNGTGRFAGESASNRGMPPG